jgi:hypothetical protein
MRCGTSEWKPPRAGHSYNVGVARGWESKAIESQMESFEAERRPAGDPQPTPEEMERRHKKASLLLSRTRVLHDLEQSSNPRYRKLLEDSLAFLDARLAELE